MPDTNPLIDPVPQHFRPTAEEVLDLVIRHPLAWAVAPDLSALLMPIRPLLNDEGELSGFRAHMPRWRHTHYVADPTILLLFSGPAAYISPSWFENRKQAPTWASASAAFQCKVQFIDDDAELRDSLADLVDSQEQGRPNAWRLDEIEERYASLAKHIIAFRCEILESRASFRMGQDEDEQTFANIVGGMTGRGTATLQV